MITTELSDEDLECLRDLMLELHEAGRMTEAESLVRIHAAIQDMVAEAMGLDTGTGEDDPEFVAAMEAAEADIAAGRFIPHEEVMRKWRMLDGG